ncbi:MAG TPA: hypothetical protein VHQ65_11790 [Thermoanaerobaculia bacterium]|nr:hypothetical protein [Thermoanaerobaculia bacterium]
MLRLRAVRALLVDDVAGLRVVRGEEIGPDEELAREREALERARRRALLMAALDLVAIAVLFVLREPGRVFLFLGRGEETVFTLGVLAIAVHLGFRLAQYQSYRDLARLYEELVEREP